VQIADKRRRERVAKVVIIGAGLAGHTAALYLGDAVGRQHEITVVNKSQDFLWLPSLVWVGIDRMRPEKTHFPLRPIYNRMHVNFVCGSATAIHPDDQYVVVQERNGKTETTRLDYDYLIVATGPHLDFEATPGLGPEQGTTYSICNTSHVVHARDKYLETVARMRRGERQTLVIGMGHGSSACEGAAFEYITNIHKDLLRRGVRDKAELIYLTNEPRLGDFGIRGTCMQRDGKTYASDEVIGAILNEYNIRAEIQKAVTRVEPGRIYWEDFDGNEGDLTYDFAMLLPRFTGSPMKYIGSDNEDLSDKLVNPAGFVLVDGIYGLPYEELSQRHDAWPAVYQNPTYRNIFAAGISFAPPGPISEPHVNPRGTAITPAPPRTGMVAGIVGRVVAQNIIELLNGKEMTHQERMSGMPVACIASMGDSLWNGMAAVILIHPFVPDYRRFPQTDGRDHNLTNMEVGLAGAWMKRMLHSTFIHKFKGNIGWKLIPE
jgi:sulfide:quinone oxidoreductase